MERTCPATWESVGCKGEAISGEDPSRRPMNYSPNRGIATRRHTCS
jgi:hypothetical protein